VTRLFRSPQAPQDAAPRFRYSLRVSLATTTTLMITVTAVAISAHADLSQRRAADALVRPLADQVGQTVIAQTLRYLEPAANATRVLALSAARVQGEEGVDDLVALAAGLVEAHPQLASCYLGTEDGRLRQIRREPEGLVRRDVDLRDGARVETRSPVSGGPPASPARPTDYDPRERPWFRAARSSGQLVWTDTYQFFTLRQPGVTVAMPVGTTGAAVACDVAMGALSGFLAAHQASPHSVSIILNQEDKVIAHPTVPLFVEGDPTRLVSLGDLPEPWVAALSNAQAARAGGDFELTAGGERYLASVTEFPADFGQRWRLAVVLPVADVMAAADRARLQSILISGLVLAVAVLMAGAVARHVSQPIVRLAQLVGRVRDFELDNDFSTHSRIREVEELSSALASMQAGLLSFSRFVPSRLVSRVVRAGEVARLGGEMRRISVLFNDLRGYSTIVETVDPKRVVQILTEYFEAMQEVIEAHQGCVLEYVGDAILVVFGAPEDLPDHEACALRCAIAMRERLVRLNAEWDEAGTSHLWRAHGMETLSARIGLHTGTVIAGNLGCRSHMKYGVVGDAVNVAARLEQKNKELGTTILVSAELMEALPPALQAQGTRRGEVVLKGRAQPQAVFSF
jgi:adenylate cyclase